MALDLPPEDFEQQVRDCLVHLYDFTVLQTNALARQIAPDLTGLERVQTVRRILIETVEQLKTRETVGTPSRQERVYSLLLLRYVEGLPIQEVLQQLALSERQFYREHHRAIQTISQLLWDRLTTNQPGENVISVKSEIQRLSSQSSYASIDVEALLLGALTANTNLAEHCQVTIQVGSLQALGDFIAHQAVLRQAVIWMLSQFITHASPGSYITLSTAIIDSNPVLNFEISGTDISALNEILMNNTTIAEFMTTLKGTITISEASWARYRVQLQLQRHREMILMIDDNPDAVTLLERYVMGMPYEIVSAYEADEGIRLAHSLQPSWIILDIMLPHTDGWKMLQNLKSHPRTLSIPVLICSVLENPDLALSLGADAYFRKPPDRVSFLEALKRLRASEH